MVLETAQKILDETRTSEDSERRRLTAEKSQIEKAMHEAEDSRFKTHTLSDEAFQRIYFRYEAQIKDTEDELSNLSKNHSKGVQALEKILRLAKNIGKAYEEADFTNKRSYLGLFFKQFKVRNGKISSFSLTDDLKPLIESGSVRVSNNGLPREDSNLEP